MAGSHGLAKKIFKGSPGGHVTSEKPVRRLEKLESRYRPPARMEDPAWNDGKMIGGDGNARIAMNRRFPIEVGQSDPHDRMFDIKQQYIAGKLQDPEGNIIKEGKLGQAIFDEGDKAYLARKEDQRRNLEYESFAASVFNLEDPATAALVSNILPGYYQKREAEIDKQAKLQSQLAKIRLRGYPANEEELTLVFGLRKGLINLPDGPLWDPSRWGVDTKEAALARGWFNPLRWVAGAAPYSSVDAPFSGVGVGGRGSNRGLAFPGVGRPPVS